MQFFKTFSKTVIKAFGLTPTAGKITANDVLKANGSKARYESTIDRYGRKSAELIAVDTSDAEAVKLAKSVNAKSEELAEFRLRYMQAYEPEKFLNMCIRQNIDPAVFGPSIPNMPTDFRNWPIAA